MNGGARGHGGTEKRDGQREVSRAPGLSVPPCPSAPPLLLVFALAACVGPSPRPDTSPVPAPRGVIMQSATRRVLDSIAAQAPEPFLTAPLAVDTAGQVAWIAMLRDSQIVGLVNQALRNNLDYQAARARVEEYRALFGAARGEQLPRLDASGSVGRQRIAFGTQALEFSSFRATADVAWEVDFWGRVRRTAQAARYDWSGREDDRRAVVLTLVSSVVTAYLELRELDEDVRIAEQTLASRRETYRLARERFGQGLISELDVRQFESEVATSAVRLTDFLRQRTQKENQLSVLLGQAPGDIPRGAPLDSAVRAVVIPDSLSSVLLARRPDVLRARDDWSAALARLGAAQAARLPRFMITASYGRQNPALSDLFGSNSNIYNFQAGVAVPLFTGGRVSGAQRAAGARADQARFRYEQTVLDAVREASDAMVGIRLYRDQLAAQETQTRALRRALELAQRRYGSGVSSYLEVLDVQRGLFNAELALNQARRLYLAATVQLYKAVGGSWTEVR